MMNERLQTLAKKIEENEELKVKLEELSQKEGNTSADYVALCQEYGIEITEEDLQPAPVELSEDELEAVTGGAYRDPSDTTYGYVECRCVVGGGGDGVLTEGNKFNPCACVAYGYGDATVKRTISTDSGTSTMELGNACSCPLCGQGFR